MNPVHFTDYRNLGPTGEEPPEHRLPKAILIASNTESGVEAYWLGESPKGGRELYQFNSGRIPLGSMPAENSTRWDDGESTSYWDSLPSLYDYSVSRRLANINDGTAIHEWESNELIRFRENWLRCASICSVLELTRYQTIRVLYAFSQLSLRHVGLGIETTTLLLAALVCREDGRQFTRHPSSKSEDPLFEEFAQEYGITDKTVRRWLKKLPEHAGISHLFNHRQKRPVPEPAEQPYKSPEARPKLADQPI